MYNKYQYDTHLLGELAAKKEKQIEKLNAERRTRFATRQSERIEQWIASRLNEDSSDDEEYDDDDDRYPNYINPTMNTNPYLQSIRPKRQPELELGDGHISGTKLSKNFERDRVAAAVEEAEAAMLPREQHRGKVGSNMQNMTGFSFTPERYNLYKQRNVNKEIQPPMRFSERSSVERLTRKGLVNQQVERVPLPVHDDYIIIRDTNIVPDPSKWLAGDFDTIRQEQTPIGEEPIATNKTKDTFKDAFDQSVVGLHRETLLRKEPKRRQPPLRRTEPPSRRHSTTSIMSHALMMSSSFRPSTHSSSRSTASMGSTLRGVQASKKNRPKSYMKTLSHLNSIPQGTLYNHHHHAAKKILRQGQKKKKKRRRHMQAAVKVEHANARSRKAVKLPSLYES
mmetsp:Transcript_4875/g.7216  ORF Transcript_4875/g.7216 Transcript_4875/m.7216 type:complete len:396 (+) Transcript_4875:105-1292(+)